MNTPTEIGAVVQAAGIAFCSDFLGMLANADLEAIPSVPDSEAALRADVIRIRRGQGFNVDPAEVTHTDHPLVRNAGQFGVDLWRVKKTPGATNPDGSPIQ